MDRFFLNSFDLQSFHFLIEYLTLRRETVRDHGLPIDQNDTYEIHDDTECENRLVKLPERNSRVRYEPFVNFAKG
jgi:hypothetical protein